MQKTLKIVGLGVAVLLGILVLAAVVLTLVFDPNQYKPELIQLVKDKTGRELRIEKKIGWSFFPRLGIEAGGVELANAPGFGKDPFARVESAGVHVAFLPLLRGAIDVDRVYLHGLDLNLAKDQGGRNNWDDLTATKAGKPEPKPEPGQKAGGKLPLEALSIGAIEIRRANLNWRDAQAGSTLSVRNFELATGRFVANQPTDLKLGFELVRDQAAPVKAALASRVTAGSDLLKLANVDLKVDDSRLTGDITVHNFASPALQFDLALDQINLDRYLGGGKPAEKKKGKESQSAGTGPAPSALRSLNIDGKLKIQKVQVIGLRISDIQTRLNARNGLIALSPTTASLYGGTLKGETVVDARGTTAQLRLDEKLEKVQVGPLLKDMQLFDSYDGTGNIAINVTASGLDAMQVRRTLNGTATLSFQDGRIEGIDLENIYQVINAKGSAIEKAFQIAPKKTDVTKFGEMGATFRITNGVAATNDLKIRMATLVATGRGSEDLVRERNDMRIDLAEAKNVGVKCKSIPVRLRGSFTKPEVNLDDEYAKCFVQKKMEKELKKGLGDILQKKLKK